MYISKIEIENYRCFGEKEEKLILPIQKGLTILVGENDAGKTAIVDAIRVLLGTSDQEKLAITEDDFHLKSNHEIQATTLRIQALIRGLNESQQSLFAEYLTYSNSPDDPVELNLIFEADRSGTMIRSIHFIGIPVGSHGLGHIDKDRHSNLRATYLRPLRDAEKAMDIGRNSRISKILSKQSNIDSGSSKVNISAENKKTFSEVVKNLGITGIAHLVNQLLESHDAIKEINNKINNDLLGKLQMLNDNLQSSIGVGPNANNSALNRQMLEKIGIALRRQNSIGKCGLGSNNLLYIACELLLLGSSPNDLGLLLIEEPEAHLHPQRQLKLMSFLKDLIDEPNNYDIQVLATTHSPTLASKLPVRNMVIINKAKILPMIESDMTQEEFIFLERFLDATKANLFFCRGLIIVEGDAENLLLPTLAKLIGKDLAEYGVSIVNVGHTGLSRYAKIFNGSEKYPNPNIPVACLHDIDLIDVRTGIEIKQVSDDKAKEIKKQLDDLDDLDDPKLMCFDTINSLLGSNFISGFTENDKDKEKIKSKMINNAYDGNNVKGFYSEPWTLEYALAYHGLDKELLFAALLAKAERSKSFGYSDEEKESINKLSDMYYAYLNENFSDRNVLCGKIYELFLTDLSIHEILQVDKIENIEDHRKTFQRVLKKKASKAAAAQHLGVILENDTGKKSESDWRKVLPPAVIEAIDHVTQS